jgi:hypothetical protein
MSNSTKNLAERMRRYSCSEHGTDFALGGGCVACEGASETHEVADRIEALEAEKKAIAQFGARISRDAGLQIAAMQAEIDEYEAENAALKAAIAAIYSEWYRWRDDDGFGTDEIERVIDEAGELIPPQEQQE